MKILLLLCLKITITFASTKYLIINGGHSKAANRTTYYEQIKLASDSIKAAGGEPIILNADGTWNNHDQPITDSNKPKVFSGVRNITDIKKALDSLNLTENDDLVVYFTGHGDAPDSYSSNQKDPHSLSTFTLWNQEQVSWNEMGDLLGSYNTSNLKLVTDVCNGGGVHYLSQKLENTCSVSAVPFYMKSSSGVRKTGLFADAFWDKFGANENFMGASINAFTNDMGNPGMGSLSSFDYIDYVLGTGQYQEENKFQNIDPQIRYMSYIDERFDQDLIYFRDYNLDQTLSVNSHTLHGDCYHCENEGFVKISSDIESLINNTGKMSHSLVKEYFPDVFRFAQDFMASKDEYRRTFQELNSEEIKLKSEYDSLVRRYSRSSSIVKWIVDYDDKKKKLLQKKKELRQRIKRELGPLFVYGSMVKNLKNIDRFFEIASKEQKDKFINILKCEHESI